MTHAELCGFAEIIAGKWSNRDLNPSLSDSLDSALSSTPYLAVPSDPTLSTRGWECLGPAPSLSSMGRVRAVSKCPK